MDVVGKIRDLAESKLGDQSHFIVDVLYLTRQRPPKVMVIIDGDQGVTIEVCANLSRALSKVLDEQNFLETNYLLEVSTPGLDHPLKLTRQYFKNVGRQFRVHLRDKTIVQGKLECATESGLVLEQAIRKGKKTGIVKTEIRFEEIERAFVMVSFK